MERALSVGQEALWFINRMAPESAAYNVAYTLRWHSPLDPAVLSRAVGLVTRRHDVLRSVFTEIEGVPRRIVSDVGLFRLEVREVAGVAEDRLAALAHAEVTRPFRLASGPPARLVLLRRAPDDAVLVLAAHHIAMDLTAQILVLRDLLDAYQALLAGGAPSWVPLTASYDEFVTAERRLLESPRAAEIVAYWRELCDGAPTLLDLPTDRPRPAAQRLRGASRVFQMPDDIVAGVPAACRVVRATPARFLIGVFQALLHRYTRQPDFLLGCAVTPPIGLHHRGVAGYFVNAVPTRFRAAPGATFRDVVSTVNGQLKAAMARADYPFALLPRALGLPRVAGTSPMFQVLVSVASAGQAAPLLAIATGGHGTEVEYAGVRLSAYEVPQQEGQFDLTLELIRGPAAIRCALKYDTDLFDAATVDRLAEHYRRLLRAAIADPDRCTTEVPLTDDTERARLLAFATGQPAATPA